MSTSLNKKDKKRCFSLPDYNTTEQALMADCA
jgi:hypothetical protein